MTIFACFAVALLCWRASIGASALTDRTSRQFWQLSGTVFVALGLSHAFALLPTLVEIARQVALQGGWYESRRHYQILFLELVALTVLVVIASVLMQYRASRGPINLAIASGGLLCGFVIGRVASFHDADAFLGQRLVGLRVSSLIELTGIGLVALAALWQIALNARNRAHVARRKAAASRLRN